jgi:glutamate N-acetyltransferase/amino-acid N-acetyltransferase
MSHKRSPLAPKKAVKAKPVKGVRLATMQTGLRYKGRDDLLLVVMPKGTSVAGSFTTSLTCAAPVQWCRKILKSGKAQALLVNAGNANAATGAWGKAIVDASVAAVAAETGCTKSEVYVASTGIIGKPLPKTALAGFVPQVAEKLNAKMTPVSWDKAAAAIMTTDTFPKMVSRTAKIGGKKVTITGFCKGSGMIAPNMATLLGFVFTDAVVSPKALQAMTTAAVDKSFNSITVDGDTSTNDTLLAFATGVAGNTPIASIADRAAKDFVSVFEGVLMEMAQLIVRDGEGAQKFITLDVKGAASDTAARAIALTIANSPLVKTAIAGEDANWGRILGAAGRAGEKINPDKLGVAIGGTRICRNGQQVKNYDETPVTKHMKGQLVDIEVEVGVGKGKARVWTCDLTHGYIDINGSYRS